ncbi:MAG: S8 family serine peptidase [Flavobacteriales bacterium]
MSKGLRLTLTVIVAVMMQIGAFGQSSDGATLDGELYVKLKDHINIRQNKESKELPRHIVDLFKTSYAEFGINHVEASFHFANEAHLRRILRLYFTDNEKKYDLIRTLEQLDFVDYAEPVPFLQKSLTPNDLGANTSTGSGQWFLHRIRAQQAWDISTGSTNIRVAVVDDAVLVTHPDLAANCVQGRDVALNNNNPNPPAASWDHGTHVAGIVSAATNNGVGVASIGWNTRILPVKASNSATSISHGYEGVTWASNNGARVINMSWGGTFGGSTGANVVNAAFNNGVTLIAAAGNDNVSTVFFPAGYNNVISVASTTTNDAKSGFSNFGSWIDISAPGSSIRSTITNNNYGFKSGTSMASPLVSGLAGLILAVNPAFTPTQVKNCLQSSADNINQQNPNFIGSLGAGRINAENALICASASTVAFDAGITAIVSPSTASCESTINPTVTLRNFGSNPITSITISYQLNNQTPQTFNWTGNLAPQTNVQLNLPSMTANIGENTFSATTTGQINGNQNDAFPNNNSAARVFSIISPIGVQLPFTEDFESGSFATNQWTIENPDNWLTWEVIQVAGPTTSSTTSARLPFYSYSTTGQRDGLITRTLDFSGYTDITMTFKHAYRRYNTASSDSLIILVSTDCGATWPTRVFARGENGTGTLATAVTSVEDFIPTAQNVWCGNGVGASCFSIDLSQFAGQPSVRIKFEAFNNYGNNLYLDDINIDGLAVGQPPVANFIASGSTSICAGSQITFTNQSTNAPQSYLWSFPGATPASSTAVNPTVTYNTPGTYTVELTASNAIGSDTETRLNYITVHPQPVLTAAAEPSETCKGNTVTLTASGANTYTWFPVSGLTQGNTGATVAASPNNTITYTVNGASAQGCISTAQVTVTILDAPTIPVISYNEEQNILSTNALAPNYQWLLNNVPITGANGPTHTPTQSGNYSVEVLFNNGCGSRSSSINVVFTGIADAAANQLLIFPNPNDGRFMIKLNDQHTYHVEVYNMLGALVGRLSISNQQDNQTSADFSYLESGVYILRVIDQKGKASALRFTKM